MPRLFYQYFVHFLSFPEHLWMLLDDWPNVSVRLEIRGQCSQQWGKKKTGKHKEELASQKTTLRVPHRRNGENQLLVGAEHSPRRVRVVLEADVPVTEPSVAYQLCLQCALSSFSTTTQVLYLRWAVDWSAATVWTCASGHAPHPETILVISVCMTRLPPLTTGDYTHHVTSEQPEKHKAVMVVRKLVYLVWRVGLGQYERLIIGSAFDWLYRHW